MFGSKKKKELSKDQSPWGGSSQSSGTSGGGDFWGGAPSGVPNEPPSHDSKPVPEVVMPLQQGAPRNVIELVDPAFLFICSQHRVSREGKQLTFSSVRLEAEKLIDEMERRSRLNPTIQQQFEKLRDPLLWYIDYWFGSSGEFPEVRDQWNNDRMGEYPDDDEEGSLAGDEAFFDELDKALKADAQDDLANERLAFYYIGLGLGFTGVYFKSIPEHQNKLRDYMERLYPRVRKFIDANPTSMITPECYNYTDKRDFVAPIRDRPIILFASFLCLLATFVFGYLWFYGEHKKSLEQLIDNIRNTSAVQSSN